MSSLTVFPLVALLIHWILIGFSHSVSGQKLSNTLFKTTTNEVTLAASSSIFHPNFTSSLTLNCSFPHDPDADVALVNSVILAKSATTESRKFQDVATITLAAPRDVEVKDALGGQVKGQIEMVNGTSFISYVWQFPTAQVEGRYVCIVYGMDHQGRGTKRMAGSVIKNRSIDLKMILDKFYRQELRQQELMSELDEVKSLLNTTQIMINQSNPWSARSSSFLKDLLVGQKFVNYTVHGNHYYILSDLEQVDINVFRKSCAEKQGYLVEVNDEVENRALQKFVDAVDLGSYYIYTGMGDGTLEGKFTYWTTGEAIAFEKWASGEPNQGTAGNCLRMKTDENLAMYDNQCVKSSERHRYICEIECGAQIACL